MKRLALLIMGMIIMSSLLPGCTGKDMQTENTQITDTLSPTPMVEGNSSETTVVEDNISPTSAEAATPEPTQAPEKKVIVVWDYSSEVIDAVRLFKELHPDFKYEIKLQSMATVDSSYHVILDDGFAAGGQVEPDIYSVDSAFALQYIRGEKAKEAATYKELGIDVDRLLKESAIQQYVIDMGTNSEGEVVALAYQSTIGAFIYRRSIAKDVWGTDDPDIIKTKIGPGWKQFLKAAAQLKAKGYSICTNPEDIWRAVTTSAEHKWIENGELIIDPKREEYIDLAMELEKNDYTNNARPWLDEWYEAMRDEGEKKVFGYLGPTWLFNYVISGNSGGEQVGKGTYGDWAVCEPPVGFFWGGTFVMANKDTQEKDGVAEILTWMTLDSSETGLQAFIANGKFSNGKKETVISNKVMEKADGRIDFLGGQNCYDVYIPAGEKVRANNMTMYDETIEYWWLEQVREYTGGNKTRQQAIEDFKKTVYEKIPEAFQNPFR